MIDSEEAVVAGKLINLRYYYYVLHLISSDCFHLSTYFRREELLKFNINYHAANKVWSDHSTENKQPHELANGNFPCFS